MDNLYSKVSVLEEGITKKADANELTNLQEQLNKKANANELSYYAKTNDVYTKEEHQSKFVIYYAEKSKAVIPIIRI